jgi:hypothetical protein
MSSAEAIAQGFEFLWKHVEVSSKMNPTQGRPPVLLLSHGTTLLTGDENHIREYWVRHGECALRYGIKGVIIMASI